MGGGWHRAIREARGVPLSIVIGIGQGKYRGVRAYESKMQNLAEDLRMTHETPTLTNVRDYWNE